MSKYSLPSLPQCPMDYAFQHLGGKHKGRLLWNLQFGPLRYGQLRSRLRDISPKMLTQALQELEADELVTRQAFVQVPPRVEYALHPSARPLLPVIDLLRAWAENQMARGGVPRREHDLPVEPVSQVPLNA